MKGPKAFGICPTLIISMVINTTSQIQKSRPDTKLLGLIAAESPLHILGCDPAALDFPIFHLKGCVALFFCPFELERPDELITAGGEVGKIKTGGLTAYVAEVTSTPRNGARALILHPLNLDLPAAIKIVLL